MGYKYIHLNVDMALNCQTGEFVKFQVLNPKRIYKRNDWGR